MSVAENLETLYRELPPNRKIQVVVVTKYATIAQMHEAFNWGVRDFGENRIQDLSAKLAQLPEPMVNAVRWHFLGHLQRNKINKAVGLPLNLIHSLDSVALAQALSQAYAPTGKGQPVLAQVNVTQEPQKTGFGEETLKADFERLLELEGLQIKGLMAIGPHTHDGEASKATFNRLRMLRDMLSDTYAHPLPELSMGMSQDFAHAIECGATIIRIGNRIFGS